MENHPYKHKYDACQHTLHAIQNVDEFKRFTPIYAFIDKYKTFDVQKLTSAMKNMEQSGKIPPNYLIRYAEDINLPRISLVINLQNMLSMALALKLKNDKNMINIYNDTTKQLLEDVTKIIDKDRSYIYYKDQEDHIDLISVQNMLESESKLGEITF